MSDYSEVVGKSWDKLAGKHKELVNSFYERLFERYPEYQPLFSEAMDRQLEKMVEGLALLARVSHETEVVHPKMVKLGEKHSNFRLTAEDLTKFKEVFLEVLSKYCGNEFSDECWRAWNEAFDQQVIPSMTQGMRPTRAQESPPPPMITKTSTRTSARNQLEGVVKSIKPQTYHGDIVVQLKGGAMISANLTSDSIKRLGLVEGRRIYALIRAPHLILVKANSGLKFSAANNLCGKVVHILPARLSTEISIELQGGEILKAQVPADSIEELGIKEGEHFCAIFKASNVVLAVEE